MLKVVITASLEDNIAFDKDSVDGEVFCEDLKLTKASKLVSMLMRRLLF